jgi:hypothetical protein
MTFLTARVGIGYQTDKQQLPAIQILLDWLMVGRVLPFNPAASV